MTVYSLSEAQSNLERVLDAAARQGGVEIRRDDGRTFVLKPAAGSRLDVPGVATDVTAEEIVSAVRETRERTP